MIIINKSAHEKYSTLAHRSLLPSHRSADVDACDFEKTLKEIVKSCGGTYCIRFNDAERHLVNRVLELDKEGSSFKVKSTRKPTALSVQLVKEETEKAAKIASIESARAKEKAIMQETNYASRRDIDMAEAKASNIKGNVKAKKLDQKDVTGTVSLTDLMGDNRFIEESMKKTNIHTAMASEEGWDMKKIAEAKKSEDTKDVPEEISTERDRNKQEVTTTAGGKEPVERKQRPNRGKNK